MKNIFSYEKSELEDFLVQNGYKKFLASQIIDWVYQKKVYNPDDFLNIKNETREFLKNNIDFSFINIEKVEEDKDAKKFLFRLFDGEKIEAVLMYHNYGISICVSSQVGCNMGCKFCESGRLKKRRNLETYEIVEQIILAEKYISEKITSVVIMGIGEPFDNYDNIVRFIKIINDPKTLAIGARHITVSTCGLIPKIEEFANISLQVNLAVSLHAPNQKIRESIMPISKVYHFDDLINAIKKYINITKRRVTIEYILLKNVNDSKENALELANVLKDMNVYVNLIPYNETNNIDFKTSDKRTCDEFFDTLKQNKIDVTMRRKFGTKISAACGQLRSKEM